jgi:hypothetical protein
LHRADIRKQNVCTTERGGEERKREERESERERERERMNEESVGKCVG